MKLKASLKSLISVGLVLSAGVFLFSCQKASSTSKPTKDIERMFLESFENTYKLAMPVYTHVKLKGNTFWIYIAQDKELITFARATAQAEKESDYFLQLKGTFYNNNFEFIYNIAKILKIPDKDSAGEEYIGITQDFTQIARELNNKASSSIADIIYDCPPELQFFVIVIADIQKGIELKFIIHRADAEKSLFGIIPNEEFNNRILLKVKGDEKIVNDKTGRHLDYQEIELAKFITELSLQQIRQGFTRLSDAQKTTAQIEEIILKTVFKFSEVYDFSSFEAVNIMDASSLRKVKVGILELRKRFKEVEV